jgi:hypothetical protein
MKSGHAKSWPRFVSTLKAVLPSSRPRPESPDARGWGRRGGRRASVAIGGRLEVFRLESCPFCDSGEHLGSDFVPIMEGEHCVRPSIPCEDAVRSGHALNAPSDVEQGGKDTGGLRSRPLTHAATKETFSSF